MRPFLLILCLLGLPILSGCTNDAAALMIEDRNHSLSLEREQPYFWESYVNYSLVVTRIPVCQRKHFVMRGNPLARTEVFDLGGGTFVLRQSKKMFVTETRTCQGFAPLDEVPPQGLGTLLGRFQEKDGEFRFWPETQVQSAPIAAPAPAETSAPPVADSAAKPAQ